MTKREKFKYYTKSLKASPYNQCVKSFTIFCRLFKEPPIIYHDLLIPQASIYVAFLKAYEITENPIKCHICT